MIRADEARGRQKAQHTNAVQSCEREIDRAIEAGDPSKGITVSLNGPLHSAVVEALTELYEAGGWSVQVTQGSDQKDGAWATVALRPRGGR